MKPIANPPNPFDSHHRELLEPAPHVVTQVFEEHTGAILSRNDSPDLPFRWSVNPYRGCFHACAYCYARPSHQYWGFGAGTDFESKLIVKPNAAEALRTAFLKPSWKGELVVFSGNTDCYQPLEATYELTRSRFLTKLLDVLPSTIPSDHVRDRIHFFTSSDHLGDLCLLSVSKIHVCLLFSCVCRTVWRPAVGEGPPPHRPVSHLHFACEIHCSRTDFAPRLRGRCHRGVEGPRADPARFSFHRCRFRHNLGWWESRSW